ncbi:MAG: DUF4423 domain-containing protein [Bdellovibrionales bacterium]|nr:DUF4423 domain-containing protein [Bdellovibrionales bacterium]
MDYLDLNVKAANFNKMKVITKRKVNYQILSQEILTELRGGLSQRELSQLLGFSFNQVGKWESGATKIKWNDFLLICEKLNVPLTNYFSYYFNRPIETIDLNNISSSILASFSTVDLNNKDVLKILKKWAAHKSQIYLIDFLKILDSYPSSLFAWLMLFVDCSKIDSIKQQYNHFNNCMDAVADNPLLIYVNAALKVNEYQMLKEHDELILAKHACIQVSHLKKSLNILLDLGIIHYDGKKYHPCKFDFSFSNLKHRKLRKFHKYCTVLAGDGYPLTPMPIDTYRDVNISSTSSRVNAISKEASDKIGKLIAKFHNEVTDVIQNDHGIKNNVQIILLHSFSSCLLNNIDTQKLIDLCDTDKLPK